MGIVKAVGISEEKGEDRPGQLSHVRKRMGMALLFCLLFLCLGATVQGAPFRGRGTAYTGWKTKKGSTYYYKEGKKVKGFRRIGNWYYYFDSSGVMSTGWTRVKGQYRYFGKRTGRMRVSTVVGGRRINRKGVWTPKVVLDAGHSGVMLGGVEPNSPGSLAMKAKDTFGTQGVATGVPEYELNLAMAKRVEALLKKRGCRVVMIRTDNQKGYSCIQRAEAANRAKADVFLRIHANGGHSPSLTGAMTICTTRACPYGASLYKKSRALSDAVLDAYVKETGCRREFVWETDTMTGNNWSKVPVTILEMGYMTNPAEDRLMQQPGYQKKMAMGIVKGIERYLLEN